MGKQKQYYREILEIISNSINGIKPKDILKQTSCCKATLFNNLKRLRKDKEIIKRKNEYYKIDNENRILLTPKYVIGFRDYQSPLTLEILTYYLKKKGLDLSSFCKNIDKKVLENFLEEFPNLQLFDSMLSDSIEIYYQGKKQFHLTDNTQNKIIAKIQKIIYDFILTPEVFLNIDSLSDLEIKFTFSFGKNMDKKLNKNEFFNFSEFKEKITNTFLGNVNNLYLSFFKNIARLDPINYLKEIGRSQFAKRNQREFAIKEQLSLIKNKISSYDIFKDQKISFYNILKEHYRVILRKYTFLEREDNEIIRKNLRILTQKFLKYIGSISKGPKFEKEADRFLDELKNYITNFNDSKEETIFKNLKKILIQKDLDDFIRNLKLRLILKI